MTNLFETSRHFISCTAVNNINSFCTKAECHAGSIHCNVSGTTNYYVFCFVNWSCTQSERYAVKDE